MKLIRGVTITDSVLDSSTVLEAVPTAYDSGTTYAEGDIRSVSGSNGAHTVYESLQDGNTGNTPASSPLWWQAKGTVYNAYSSGHADGEIVTDTTNHRLYKSLTGSNSNALPPVDTNGEPTSDANWSYQGPTNRWAPFDGKSGTVAQWDGSASYTLSIPRRIDTLQLLNLTGKTVNITMVKGSTELHNRDYTLRSSKGLRGWTNWLFEPRVYKTDLAIEDLPNNYNPDLTVTITGAGIVGFGTINPGLARKIGDTQYGATAGRKSYSLIKEDDFGVKGITKRDSVKIMQLEVWVEAADVDPVFDLLNDYDAVPVGVIGASQYGVFNQFGLIKDWRERVAYPSHSILDFDFEGL